MSERERERANLLMDRERQPQYDGLTTGRFGFSDDDWTPADGDWTRPAPSGVDVAYVDHPHRWARMYRRLHNIDRHYQGGPR